MKQHWKNIDKFEHLANFEPFQAGFWPNEFDLHEVPEIPKQPL
jgi:hypothetical protein